MIIKHLPPSVVLLGFTVDDQTLADIAQRSAVMPTQTHRFAWNLVGALEAGGLSVSLLSALPVPNYPEYPGIIIRPTDIEQNGVRGITLGFLNLFVLKHATRFASCIGAGLRFIRNRQPDVVVVHGVHTPFLVFARLLKRVLKLRVCLVMTDPPGVVRAVDGTLSRMLKRLDRKLLKKLASGFDGVISLTPALAIDFAPEVPRLVLEGFVNEELSLLRAEPSNVKDEFQIAYAGGINVEYGVENLVRSFQSITDPRARLRLYGKGPLDGWVLKQGEADKRISHSGLVSHKDLMPQLRQASVLVNPRPAAQDFVQYSFPSKLLEYMALGVPVVTTRLAGLPADYLPYVQVTDDDSVDALAHAIETVRSNYPTAVERASQGQAYVVQQKSVAAQGARISAFFSELGVITHDDSLGALGRSSVDGEQ
jgi:glycosyltransferase involved in cell wall biosynthesis